MPRLTITAGKFLDDYVKPFAQEIGPVAVTAFGVFRNAVIKDGPTDLVGLVPASFELDFDIPNPFPAAPSGGGTAAPPAPGLAPIEPGEVLARIAAAVRDAEGLLNDRNLAVLTADVDVTLVVNVGGVAGANASFKMHIGPTPQG